jgi:hypothetical protein
MKRSIFAVAWVASLAFAPSAARADHNWYGGGSLSALIVGHPRLDGYGVVRAETGVHPIGTAEGFFVGLVVSGGLGTGGWFADLGFRLGYDLPVFEDRRADWSLQIGPWAMIPSVLLSRTWQAARDLIVEFQMAYGVDVRFLFAHREWTFFVRPLMIDIALGGPDARVGWEGAVGVQHNYDL